MDILRDKQQNGWKKSKKFKSVYQTDPVLPLLNFIRKNFPKPKQIASDTYEVFGFENTAILLEQLRLEAEEVNGQLASKTVATEPTEPESLF